MNNNESAHSKFHKINAYTQALMEQIDLNPTIDECVALLMSEQVIRVSLQVQGRMHELRMSPETLNLRAKVSKLELTNLLVCKSLPSLKSLWSIAKVLHCDLSFTAIPTALVEGMSIDTSFKQDASEEDAQENLSLLLRGLAQPVEMKFGSAVIFASYSEPVNSFFSTRYLFRAVASRLHTLQLDLKPTLESLEYHANVL